MGESQNITSGQDWTTEISGQLMLLDTEDTEDTEDTGGTEGTGTGGEGIELSIKGQEPVSQPVTPAVEEEEEVPEGEVILVGNTGLTQNQINAGGLETSRRKVNGNTPYEYAYIIQAATSPQNGAIQEEFFKGNKSNVDALRSYVNKLKQQYGSVFQYNFSIGDFPALDNQNVGSAFTSYESWMVGMKRYFPKLA
jgi:hypothetical protein